jgi:hypothetical protein
MRKLSLLIIALLLTGGASWATQGSAIAEASETSTVSEEEEGKVKAALKKVFGKEEGELDDGEEEEKAFPLSIGADIVARYIWRGQTLSNTPAIQPGLEYSVGNDKVGFSLGFWGSFSVAGTIGTEFDLYASFYAGPLSITFTDYFFPSEPLAIGASEGYWNYKTDMDNGQNSMDVSGHIYELMLSLGSDDFPLSGFVATNIGGGDVLTDGANGLKNGFSTYIELDYAPKDWLTVFVGMGYSKTGWYILDPNGKGYNFNVVNMGLTASHDIQLNKVSIPISATLGFNPEAQNVLFSIAVGVWN